jgi:hypothetical protein
VVGVRASSLTAFRPATLSPRSLLILVRADFDTCFDMRLFTGTHFFRVESGAVQTRSSLGLYFLLM